MITRAIENCFKTARKKAWDKTFWAVDVHNTIIVPNYSREEIPTEWYPHAKEALMYLSKREDITLILYTSSWPTEIKCYLHFFEKEGIRFEHHSENPEVPDGAYGYYKTKMYFNVLFEDKAGFDPSEWPSVINLLETKYPDGYALMSRKDLEEFNNRMLLNQYNQPEKA